VYKNGASRLDETLDMFANLLKNPTVEHIAIIFTNVDRFEKMLKSAHHVGYLKNVSALTAIRSIQDRFFAVLDSLQTSFSSSSSQMSKADSAAVGSSPTSNSFMRNRNSSVMGSYGASRAKGGHATSFIANQHYIGVKTAPAIPLFHVSFHTINLLDIHSSQFFVEYMLKCCCNGDADEVIEVEDSEWYHFEKLFSMVPKIHSDLTIETTD